MTTSPFLPRRLALSAAIAAAFAAAGFLPTQAAQPRQPNAYAVTKLVSDGNINTPNVDPNLLNAWGLVFNPTAYAWVANNHSGT